MKIVMACGGSGGHIFPAISVAEEIYRRDSSARILFACGKKEIEEKIFKGVPKKDVVEIDSAAFLGGRALWKPSFLLKLSKGFLDSRAFLKKERPDLVVGFGGYFSFPVLLAAKSLRIRSVLHEQNVVPGVANKVLARLADGVALSFEETRPRLPKHRRMTVTGNPIRSYIESDCRQEALGFFGFSPSKTTLLVLGGSQGAESINRFFLDCLPLFPQEVKESLQVLHLCGKMKPDESEQACRQAGLSCKAYSFFERMDLAYGAADIALGRAGATFLAEIQTKHIPAILIPYPYAGGHQKENARVFQRSHQAMIFDQDDVTAIKLFEAIREYAALVKKRPISKDSSADAPTHNSRARLADFMMSMLS